MLSGGAAGLELVSLCGGRGLLEARADSAPVAVRIADLLGFDRAPESSGPFVVARVRRERCEAARAHGRRRAGRPSG